MKRSCFRRWRDYRRILKELKAQPLFDDRWYTTQYPDVTFSIISPLRHFCFFGAEEGRNPAPFFDTRWYLHEYPDVVRSRMNPLLHFMTHGGREGRNPGPYFDTRWYLQEYPDVLRSGMSPLLHYLTRGIEEKRSPHPYFDATWYLQEYPDVARSGINPLLDYLEYGVELGRDPNPCFDTSWYLNEYQDVARSGMNPLLHYMKHGTDDQRDPGPDFDAGGYLAAYPDVAASGMAPLHHYLKYGVHEGRKTSFTTNVPGYELARSGALSPDLFRLHPPPDTSGQVTFDVVMVTHNSGKWVDNCLTSLLPHDSSITLTIVDNGSSDDTVPLIQSYQRRFACMTVIARESNVGFGAANNLGARSGTGNYLLFLNIDTELNDPEIFFKLNNIIKTSRNDVVGWECRQLPYEHPKLYDPASLETSWVSGAAVVVRRDAFEEAGGFDEAFFMYCEDVDLSWRLRARGYRLLYCPSVTITHHSYSDLGVPKPIAQLSGVMHNYFLRQRYGTEQDIQMGRSMLAWFSRGRREHMDQSTIERLAETERESGYFRNTRCEPNQFFQPFFDQYDYEIMREGSFYASTVSRQTDRVSIIVRTTGRLHYLERALYSIVNQTYLNVEIVIVEDGSHHAKHLVSKFSDFNVVYHSSDKVGRCRAGNLGLNTATGRYFNFLDEDDMLYCDHVETLVNAISDKPDIGAVWSSAFCVTTEESADRKSCFERNYRLSHLADPDELSIQRSNHFPIQSVLFRRECYDKMGGFDTDLDYLEDWDLWIRYHEEYPFMRVPKTTSLYRVPFDKAVSEERTRNLISCYDRVRRKHRQHTSGPD